MQHQMNTPPPPLQSAFRTISESRINASFKSFNGKKTLIYKHTTNHKVTEYYIELRNAKPCVITYVNQKCVDIREIGA